MCVEAPGVYRERMMSYCTFEVIKYCMFAFNLFMWVAGVAMIACGVYVEVQLEGYANFMGGAKIGSAAILLIIVGCVVMVLGFLGCCGAIKENYCMLMTFAIILFILLIVELVAGIVGYAMKNQVNEFIEKHMKNQFDQYKDNKQVQKSVDLLQSTLKCCGPTGGEKGYEYWKENIPASCCKNEQKAACKKEGYSPKKNDVYHTACKEKLEDLVKSKAAIIIGVGIGIAIVQILGVIFACCMGRSLKKADYESM